MEKFRNQIFTMGTVKVSVPVHFSGGIGTGISKIWYQKKVSVPVSEKFGT